MFLLQALVFLANTNCIDYEYIKSVVGNRKNLIGNGSYGLVYKSVLQNKNIAIKLYLPDIGGSVNKSYQKVHSFILYISKKSMMFNKTISIISHTKFLLYSKTLF